RLSASRTVADHQLFLVPWHVRCSTPFGITDCRGVLHPIVAGKYRGAQRLSVSPTLSAAVRSILRCKACGAQRPSASRTVADHQRCKYSLLQRVLTWIAHRIWALRQP